MNFNDEILTIEQLQIKYGTRSILKDISLSIHAGEIVAVMGKSGSGKSTLLRAIMGLLPLNMSIAGTINFQGESLLTLSKAKYRKLRGEKIACLWQNAIDTFCPWRTLGEQFSEILKAHANPLKLTAEEFDNYIAELAASFKLPANISSYYPTALSGGMGARAGFLAAMLLKPSLILADEPTAALDTVSSLQLANNLRTMSKENNVSVILVTHDKALASYTGARLLTLVDGRLIEAD